MANWGDDKITVGDRTFSGKMHHLDHTHDERHSKLVKAPDGKIYLVPNDAGEVRWADPDGKTYTIPEVVDPKMSPSDETIYRTTIAALLNMLGEKKVRLDKHDVHNARRLLDEGSLDIEFIRDMFPGSGDVANEEIKIEVVPK